MKDCAIIQLSRSIDEQRILFRKNVQLGDTNMEIHWNN